MKKFLLSLLTLATFTANAQFYPISPGAVPFGNTQRALTDDSTNFLWDDTDNQLTLGAGTAAKPAFSFVGVGNDDNGMFRAGTDIVGFAAAGVEAMRIDASGKLLLGTSGTSLWTDEQLTVINDGVSATDTAAALGVRLDQTNDAASTQQQYGLSSRYFRQITASQTDTSINAASYLNVRFNIAGSQTLTHSGLVAGAYIAAPTNASAGAIAANNFSGINIEASSLATGTNKHGIYIGAQTGATNNYAIRTLGGFVSHAGMIGNGSQTPAQLTADDTAITLTASMVRITSDSATATDRTFTITDGDIDGQELVLMQITNASELADSGNVRLSAAWQPDADDTLHLKWDETTGVWRELSRAAN